MKHHLAKLKAAKAQQSEGDGSCVSFGDGGRGPMGYWAGAIPPTALLVTGFFENPQNQSSTFNGIIMLPRIAFRFNGMIVLPRILMASRFNHAQI